MTRLLPAALALALATPAAARRPPPAPAPALVPVHRERLPDGVELVVLPVRLADAASLRVVVRAGSERDPAGRLGLAHVLEHAIAGRRGEDGGLLDAVRLAGGEMNAFTSREATWYAIDAPPAAFGALATRLLREVTGPALASRELAREQGVIRSEEALHGGDGVLELVEEVLFRSGSGVLGGARSRDAITRDDLAAFFRTYYVSTNVTVVVAGAVEPAEARALVEDAMLLPPALPAEEVAPNVGAPILPATEAIQAPMNATVLGYALDPADARACETLAALVELRLLSKLWIEEPVVGGVRAECRPMRGTPFVLATAYSRTLDAGDLPPMVDAVFKEAATRPMTVAERDLLDRRRARILDAVRADPARLADEVAALATRPLAGATPVEDLARPLSTAAEARTAAARSFVPARRVLIELSPFRQ